ncbi:MAG: cytochrome b/b6 domain-containing protein [Syntrophorhabdaceae bacterium]|nr:cytochrome b/b6 domain-containing protein [Syntrophorhabdaceae bacterium]
MKNAVRHYPLWLRAWHWSNVILFLVLLVTGMRMHYGFQVASFHTTVLIHNIAGVLLVAFYLMYMLGNLFLGNGRYYMLKLEDIWPGILNQAIYYLNGIFLGRPHPYPHGEDRKFNPIQKLTYIVVILLLIPAIIITGLALLFSDRLPLNIMGLPGISFWAVAHTCICYFFVIFMAVHMYLATTGHTLSELYLMMLLGDEAGHKEERALSHE